MLKILHDMISEEVINNSVTRLTWMEGGLDELYQGVPFDKNTGKIFVEGDIFVEENIKIDVGENYIGSLFITLDGPREVDGLSIIFDKSYSKKVELVLKDIHHEEFLYIAQNNQRALYFLTRQDYIVEIEVRFHIIDRTIKTLKIDTLASGWKMTYQISDMIEPPKITQCLSNYITTVEYDELYFYLSGSDIPINTNQKLELTYYDQLLGVFFVKDFDYTKFGIKITARNSLNLLESKEFLGRYLPEPKTVEEMITNLMPPKYSANFNDVENQLGTGVIGLIPPETYIQVLFDLINSCGYSMHTSNSKNVEFMIPNKDNVVHHIKFTDVFENYSMKKDKEGYTGIEMSSYILSFDEESEILTVEDENISIYALSNPYKNIKKNGVLMDVNAGYVITGEFTLGDKITGEEIETSTNLVVKERDMHINEASHLLVSKHNTLINNTNVNDLVAYYLPDVLNNDTVVIKADVPITLKVGDCITVDLDTIAYKGIIIKMYRLITDRRNIVTITINSLQIIQL